MQIWSSEIKELEILYTSLKGRFPDLKKDLEHLIKTDDENVALLYSRRCLEIIITDLCERELKRPRKTEPLKGIIDKLGREEKVPAHIITSMDHLNSLSTFGTHPKEFDPEQVKPVLFNLTTVIKWYLKYNDNKAISKSRTEEVKHDHKDPDNVKERILKPGRKKMLMFTGILIIVAIVIVALYLFDIIGGGKQTKVLEKSIAVLPFINDSPDQENVYFINGIMEEVLNNLQTIKDLRVISRSSVEQYRDLNRPTSPEIAKKLDVNYIVEGSGQKYGNTFRLRVQLIDARTDRHLWARSYEQSIQETNAIFNLQSNIAQSIATELKAIITPEEKQIIEEIPTKNLEAYENYLLGLHYYNKDTETDLLQAIEYYNKAVDKDPEFALAYTGIAWAYISLIWDNWLPEDVYHKEREAAMKAIEINDQLSEAHVALASVKLHYDWDIKEAEKELNIAISLNPNNSDAYTEYSTLLEISCRFKEALEKYKQAIALNPNSEVMRFLYGYKLYRAFEVDSAILLAELGETDQAIYWLEKAYEERHQYLLYLKSIPEMCSSIRSDPRFLEIYHRIWPDG